ncbi:hypothetical protein FACHB389_01660 [Nostoc calcicola FACHB-389]|nr:hypothetical protein [Nostoc sp. EkiNYC01]OKH42386.1 hypothetical protein FACHB389_01660 [Nostoc calcicola FACHB-389]
MVSYWSLTIKERVGSKPGNLQINDITHISAYYFLKRTTFVQINLDILPGNKARGFWAANGDRSLGLSNIT